MCAASHRPTDAPHDAKTQGVTYTPMALARFMASLLVERFVPRDGVVRVLDPSVGDGALLLAVGEALCARWPAIRLVLTGIDVDAEALASAAKRCEHLGAARWVHDDFLAIYQDDVCEADLIIANPPYVRTQAMDPERYQRVVEAFSLKGHADLSHAFMLAILDVVQRGDGVLAATIIPNSMLLTAAASQVRERLLATATLHELLDLGDTRLFDAAVLPMILTFSAGHTTAAQVDFFSSYTQKEHPPAPMTTTPIEGMLTLRRTREERMWTRAPSEKRVFELRRGELRVSEPHGSWVLCDALQRELLQQVEARVWTRMSDIGRIKVGVKSCADGVFIREGWGETQVETELLKPLMTHHVARPFRSLSSARHILYPHLMRDGERAVVELDDYPGARAYLHAHHELLSARAYLPAVGRQWFELWVPHHPERWAHDKVVWRDIAKRPTFWLDQTGSVINGDCYWLDLHDAQDADLLWLVLALGNSDFAHHFYQATSGHQIYAGRRRYMARYLKQFPIPDPHDARVVELIALARTLHASPDLFASERDTLNALVWGLWGLDGRDFESP